MEKVIIHTLEIAITEQKMNFQILLPENLNAITGISVSSNLNSVDDPTIDYVRPGIGFLHLHVADTGDELFSELVLADGRIPKWEIPGNGFSPQGIFMRIEKYKPLCTFQPTGATLIDGFYEDYGYGSSYLVKIYIHYKTDEQ